jgi:hypothetical protein
LESTGGSRSAAEIRSISAVKRSASRVVRAATSIGPTHAEVRSLRSVNQPSWRPTAKASATDDVTSRLAPTLVGTTFHDLLPEASVTGVRYRLPSTGSSFARAAAGVRPPTSMPATRTPGWTTVWVSMTSAKSAAVTSTTMPKAPANARSV